ncbi:MAG: 30S ribosomal protein S2 [Candidatus Levybacteria bacterium]|nr:30S ribosomal protein S2 [Candidatus Levybacteria bacterium]
MKEITLEELLEAGCHFGHQVTRHNPKSRDFVFEARDNIHIIDLAKTKEGLEEAAAFIKNLAANGGSLLVVGTKRQARGIVDEEIKRAQEERTDGSQDRLFYITTRWIGGILTNFSEVSKNFKKLNDIKDRLQKKDELSGYTKKEIGLWEKEMVKLRGLYGGISEMKKSPDALFIIDSHLENLAVSEATKTGVKTIGIVDTNADPDLVDYSIPANDDAVGSIKLIVSYIMDAWIEGNRELLKKNSSREKQEIVTKDVKPQEEVNKVKKSSKKAKAEKDKEIEPVEKKTAKVIKTEVGK